MKIPFRFSIPEPSSIHAWSIESIGSKIYGLGGGNITGVTAGSVPAANSAIFVPFALAAPTAVNQVFVYESSGTGNFDIGVYDEFGARLFSLGSTALSGSSQIRLFDVTDFNLGAGLFYLALSCNSGTAAFLGASFGGVTGLAQVCGVASMASAFPLPATATFATAANDFIPLVGITTRGTL